LIIFGVCLRYKTHWIGPCVGAGMAVFGYQIAVTITTTYSVDCYRPQSGYVATIFNCFRQTLSFTVPFYDMKFGARTGYAWEFGVYAIIIVVFFIPVILLGRYGTRLRERMGKPEFDDDL
jgi:hypothetical protein